MNVFYDQTAKAETDTLFSPSVSHYLSQLFLSQCEGCEKDNTGVG